MTPESLERALERFAALYAGVDGYRLSHGERKRLQDEDRALVYGEIDPRAFFELLGRVGVAPGETFWDAGSGTGKPVLLSAMLFPFAGCHGVELLEPLHAQSEVMLRRYRAEVLPQLPEEKRRQEIRFVLGRLEETDFSAADVLFSHCTTFDAAGLDQVAAKAAGMKPGSRAITVGQPLSHPALEPAFSAAVPMEWGESTCFVYRVRGALSGE
ncbi:MAG TPA: SAM-dependent methyltransferase [Myxococcaceae bacterium]